MWSNSKKRVYLDWASAVPVAPSVLRSYKKTLVAYGNPGSPHEEGRRAQDLLEDARTRIARLAEVKPGGVTFAAGATEANALGIIGHVHALMAEETPAPDVHVLYLSSAHASVLGAITKLSEEGVHVEPLTLLDGVIDQKALAGALTPHTALVVVDAVCGETGTSYDTLATRRTRSRQKRRRAGSRRSPRSVRPA